LGSGKLLYVEFMRMHIVNTCTYTCI